MTYPIRPITPDEFPAFTQVWERAFNFDTKDDELRALQRVFEFDRSFAAVDGDHLLSTGGTITFDLTTPGGVVPAGGLTAVAVLPTYRRRGILTDMIRYHFDDVKRRGEPVSLLWASESLIYGRFGYGVATENTEFDIDGRHAALRDDVIPVGNVEFASKQHALDVMPDIYATAATSWPGFLSRTSDDWDVLHSDFEHWRDGMTANRYAVYREGGRSLGYVRYRGKERWVEGHADNELFVGELIGVTPAAEAALWRYCFSVDLVTKIRAQQRPRSEIVSYLLVDPRRLRIRSGDGVWARLLDVPAALEARRYAAEGSLTIEVVDAFLPETGGTFELSGGPDGAECRRTEAAADLRVDVAGLSSRYLGGGSFEMLRRAGRADGATDAIRRADRMFDWHVAPWCPHHF
jgi:predicted acetyltransferase